MTIKRRNNIRTFRELDDKDNLLTEKINNLMRIHPRYKKFKDEDKLAAYVLAYIRYDTMVPKLHLLGERIDDLTRLSQMDKTSPEYKHATYLYYKERKKRDIEAEATKIKKSDPKRSAELLAQIAPKKIGRPRLRRASKYMV